MMRARDLKVYSIILIFFLVCLVTITGVYQAGVDTATVKNAEYQSSCAYDSSEEAITASIMKYNTLFLEGSSDVEKISSTDALFGDKSYAINNDGYVYFKNDASYGKVELQKIMKDALDDNSNAILLVSNGNVIGANQNYNSRITSLLEILNRTNSSSKSNEILDDSKKEGRHIYAATLTVASGEISGYIVSDDFSGYKLLRFVDGALIITSKDINQFKLMYWIGVILLLIGIVVNFIFMFRKISKVQAIDAGISLKGSNAVVIVKTDGKIVSYNRPFKAAFESKALPIQSMDELKVMDSELTLKDLIKEQRRFILGYVALQDEEGNKDHEDIYFEFFSAKRGVADYCLIGKDITKEYIDNQILLKRSTKSVVTGDNNSVVLERRYREVKEKYKAVKDPYLFLMVNLRGFKNINTLLGFDQGNDVLKFFSEQLHEYYDGLEIFHTKGDEFVILDEKSNEVMDIQITNKMIETFKAPFNINNNEIMLRPVVGVLGSDMDGETEIDFDMLISKLTTATNRAKNAGRLVCQYDVNLENSATKDREMEEDLKMAIQRGEFVMYYQPQYELNQDRVCGFEALLRWNNPKYATISPEVYIKMAEKNGYIVDVGNFINSEVFKTAKEMEQYDIHISVNVSPAQIVQAGFVADFLDKFEQNDLRPGAIALEVTETFLMENFNTVIEKLQILKNRGVSIHLDDFGTGYSSMLYLKELPIDTIKVDKEFIKHIETDRFSKVLTSKIITLGKELGDKIICEGVETKVQKDIVHKFGADIIQGYYIGKALSKDDAFALLKTGKVSSANKSNGKEGEE